MAQTYYEVLGVAENATNAEIEAAFKSKAREVHPDKVPPGNPYLRKVTSEAFKDLSEAKSVLLDSVERQKYDAELAYMRGSEQSYAAPATPPPPPAPVSTPQQAQKHSFWKPAKTRFGTGVLAAGALGCILFLVGVTAGDKTALSGLTLICLALALLCWRHGSRPGTDGAFLGGSVFLFISAAVSFAGWLQLAPYDPRTPSATEIPQRPVGKLTPLQAAGPPKAPVGKLTPVPCGKRDKVPGFIPDEKTCAGSETEPYGLKGTRETKRLQRPNPRDPILAAINGSRSDNTNSSVVGSTTISTLPAQSPLGMENPIQTPPRSDAGPSPEKTGTLRLATRPVQPDASNLSGPERQSIESACSNDKYNNGPAAYNRCLENQLVLLGTAPRRPDLSSLSAPEQQSIESACSNDKYNNGPAAYNRCLGNQLGILRTAPQRPDLSSLSAPERQSIESACSNDKYNNGPAAYNRCLGNQLVLLRSAPRRPDLSNLNDSERQSIESACSNDKYNNGPAAYNRCLLRQLELLKNSR